jgi:hypothetical protein
VGPVVLPKERDYAAAKDAEGRKIEGGEKIEGEKLGRRKDKGQRSKVKGRDWLLVFGIRCTAGTEDEKVGKR